VHTLRDTHHTLTDNYSSGRKKNIIHLLNNPLFEAIHHDNIEAYYSDFDEIYHVTALYHLCTTDIILLKL
jgi:hypothetical protein